MKLLILAMAISLTQPAPLPEAVEKLSAKTVVGSVLRTAEWAQIPVELRDSAFFSAGVTSAQLLQSMKDRLETAISMGREHPDAAQGHARQFPRSAAV